MEIPPINNQKWRDLITGKFECDFEFLAIKVLLFRLRLKAKTNPNETVLKKSVEELHNFFTKNQKLPLTQKDLKKMFSAEG